MCKSVNFDPNNTKKYLKNVKFTKKRWMATKICKISNQKLYSRTLSWNIRMSTKRRNLEQRNEWWLKCGIFSLIWRKIQKIYFKLLMLLYHNLSQIFNMAEAILIPPANHRGRAMDWTFLETFPTMELFMASCHENGFNKGRINVKIKKWKLCWAHILQIRFSLKLLQNSIFRSNFHILIIFIIFSRNPTFWSDSHILITLLILAEKSI